MDIRSDREMGTRIELMVSVQTLNEEGLGIRDLLETRDFSDAQRARLEDALTNISCAILQIESILPYRPYRG